MADESEEACLVNPKSPISGIPPSGMPYTDGLQPAPPADVHKHQSLHSSQHAQSSSRQSQDNVDQYDINDDIILSQFHADAIKQVIYSILH